MNREETLVLYGKGKDKWNAWAYDLLEKKEDSQDNNQWIIDAVADFSEEVFRGEADFSGFIFPSSVSFRKAQFAGTAHFQNVLFKGRANFSEAVFEGMSFFSHCVFFGEANFSNTTFKEESHFNYEKFDGMTNFKNADFQEDAWFMETKFGGSAEFQKCKFGMHTKFDRANFERDAFFSEAKFRQEPTFRRVIFGSNAEFRMSEFKKGADFRESEISGSIHFDDASFYQDSKFRLMRFKKYASFRDTKFLGDADFSAIQSDTAFFMDGVEFSKVPNFHQATFAQAPQLNTVDFGADPNSKGVFWRAWRKFLSEVLNRQASEELKALEKQGRNAEARCLALMRLATQGNDREREHLFFRKKCLARRWVIDKVWHASFWVGWLYHLFSDFGRSLSRPLVGLFTGGILFAVIYLCLSLDGSHCVACDDAGEHEVGAAFKLSLSRSLPALWGLSGFGAKVQEYSECLYGQEGDTVALLFGLLQSAFSLAMIFLFLLALRNRFRIG